MRGLVWFREDLRTLDNTALYHAAKACDQGIAGVYILDAGFWRQHDVAACRVEFVLRGLADLRDALEKLHIPLYIITVTNTGQITDELAQLLRAIDAEALYFNRQYEVNESQRDQRVTAALQKQQIAVHSYDDQVILPPGSVLSQQGQPLRIFTPYKRAWYRVFSERTIKQLPAPKAQTPLALSLQPAAIPAKLTAFQSTVDPARWPAGQGAASKRLRQFVSHHLFQYDKERDFPALDGTSQLSPYLAAGMISPRQCFLAALEANQMELDTGNAGAVVWMSELIWREFYKHLLVAAPRVSKHKAYLEVTDNIVWDNNEKQLQAWQQGQTGYPLIDAAMRQLNTLGWMHNRLRMVVAMFLTKNLFFDWRRGEKYFMSQLIDGDLAANNGGWQWSASTGTDAAPYFRIFNPIRQSERFDPEGKFILQYCPELAGFNGKSIHEPYESLPLLAAAANYPRPIIGLNDKRSRVLAAYKKTNTTVK